MSLPGPVDTPVEVPGALEAGSAIARAERTERGPAAPPWLWAAAVAVLLPVLVPVVVLAMRVLGSSGRAWDLLFSTRTASLIVRSGILTALVTVAAAALGVAAAWFTARTDLRGRRAWALAMTLPLVIPSYVFALSFLAASGPRGLIAGSIGLRLPVLDGLVGAWLALTLSTFPYVFLIVSAALHRIDPALEEAARGLGAGPARTFRTVVLPQLRAAIGAGSLLVALYTLSDFGAVSLMRFNAFPRVIYAQYSGRLDRTPAAVLSIVLVLLALTVLWFEQRSRGKASHFTWRPARSAPRQHLSPTARLGATGFLATIAVLGVGAPVAVLLAWVVRALGSGAPLAVRWGPIAGSIVGASFAAMLAVAAALPVVILAVRHRSRATDWLERAVYLTFSLPHITVALAVLLFAVRYLGPLYQSLALLVIVYATVFLAQATGSAKASLLQVNPHLEEAARGLGKGQLRTWRDVTIPLIWRGLVAGGALVFLTTMKELPVTLLLRPTGFDTLAVRIWSAADEAIYGSAALTALILLAVSAIPAYFLVLRPKDEAV